MEKGIDDAEDDDLDELEDPLNSVDIERRFAGASKRARALSIAKLDREPRPTKAAGAHDAARVSANVRRRNVRYYFQYLNGY